MSHAMAVDTPLHTDRSAPPRTCAHLSTIRVSDRSTSVGDAASVGYTAPPPQATRFLYHLPLCDMRMPHAMAVDMPLYTDHSAPPRTFAHMSTDRGRDPSHVTLGTPRRLPFNPNTNP